MRYSVKITEALLYAIVLRLFSTHRKNSLSENKRSEFFLMRCKHSQRVASGFLRSVEKSLYESKNFGHSSLSSRQIPRLEHTVKPSLFEGCASCSSAISLIHFVWTSFHLYLWYIATIARTRRREICNGKFITLRWVPTVLENTTTRIKLLELAQIFC